MKAVRFLGKGISDVAPVPDPAADPEKVLLRIWASALCGSENGTYFAEAAQSPEGLDYKVPGHEMAGEVMDPGPSDHLRKGDRVVVQIMDGCGECFYCRNSADRFCENLNYEGGTHAQFIALPEKCVIKAPDDISYDTLVLLGGDTIGVAYRATQKLSLRPGQVVYVSGAGPIGLGMITMLKHYGCFVVVSEPHAYRKTFAGTTAGADLILDPNADDIKQRLRDLTDGVGPEITIECSGHPGAQMQALDYTRCQGTVLFAGENYKELKIIPSAHVIHKELTIKGAFYFTAADFYEIVKLYRSGLKVDHLVSHRVDLKDAPDAIDQFSKGLTGKVIIHPQS